MLSLILVKVDAQTIAALIQARPGLSRAWADRANHPEWSGPGPITVFLPTDAAIAAAAPGTLPAGSLGSLTVARAMNFLTIANYQILTDTSGQNRMVYDNYRGGQPVPEIHCRFGTGEALTLENLNATNGWLYTLNRVIEPPRPLSQNLELNSQSQWLRYTQFLAAIDRADMRAELDALTDVTVLAFTDGSPGVSDLNSLSPAQLRVVILSHIIPAVRYSVALDSSVAIQTLNSGYNLNLAIGNDEVRFNGALVTLADIMVSNGVVHAINQVLMPSNLNTVTQSTTAVTQSTDRTTTTPAAGKPLTPVTDSKNTRNLSNASSRTVNVFYFGLAILSVLYFAL